MEYYFPNIGLRIVPNDPKGPTLEDFLEDFLVVLWLAKFFLFALVPYMVFPARNHGISGKCFQWWLFSVLFTKLALGRDNRMSAIGCFSTNLAALGP